MLYKRPSLLIFNLYDLNTFSINVYCLKKPLVVK